MAAEGEGAGGHHLVEVAAQVVHQLKEAVEEEERSIEVLELRVKVVEVGQRCFGQEVGVDRKRLAVQTAALEARGARHPLGEEHGFDLCLSSEEA